MCPQAGCALQRPKAARLQKMLQIDTNFHAKRSVNPLTTTFLEGDLAQNDRDLERRRSTGGLTGERLRTVQRNQPRRIKPFCLRNNSDMRRERGMCPSRTNRGTAAFVAVAARIRP